MSGEPASAGDAQKILEGWFYVPANTGLHILLLRLMH